MCKTENLQASSRKKIGIRKGKGHRHRGRNISAYQNGEKYQKNEIRRERLLSGTGCSEAGDVPPFLATKATARASFCLGSL